MSVPLLEVRGLTRHYPLRRRWFGRGPMVTALEDVSFAVTAGRSLGVVGESGSGKSTLARLIMALERPDAGTVALDGEDLHALTPARLRQRRRRFQMVFQDPNGSLDPRMTVERIVAEPLDVAEPGLGALRRERIAAALAAVGLDRQALDRTPQAFSGGQRQRIAIARALVTEPALVVADEPVSALDVSIQAQVLNLMMDLQATRGLTYVFISHDLAVVEHVADRVIVLYRGRIVESGPAGALFAAPAHPYTRALVDAAGRFDRDGRPATEIPRPARRAGAMDGAPAAPGGCGYAATCPFVQADCRQQVPEPVAIAPDRAAACLHPLLSPPPG